MRRALTLFAVTVLAAGALAASGSSRSSRVISLPVHGTVTLVGSHVRCGSGQLNGLTYIDCGISDARGEPKRGGYVALMTADGRVTILVVSTKKAVFSRAPSSAYREAATGVTIRAGDTVVLPRTSISCNASLVGGK